ncbi:hypothetical protein ES708_33100 [subsurface metagenome]
MKGILCLVVSKEVYKDNPTPIAEGLQGFNECLNSASALVSVPLKYLAVIMGTNCNQSSG